VAATLDVTSSLYPRLLGSAWPALGPGVRALHLAPGRRGLRATGCFRVRWGSSPAATGLARALRLPAPAESVVTSLSIEAGEDGERWQRVFGDRALSTDQAAGHDGLLLERFGWLELRLRLTAAEATLRYEPAGAALRLGRWRFPLPAALAPTVRAVEAPGADGATRVSVEVRLPAVGLLIAYDGWMRPEERGPG
jgi:hypothetical protein